MELPVSLNLRWNQNQVLRQTVKQVAGISGSFFQVLSFLWALSHYKPFSKQNHLVRSNLHVTLLHVS